MSELLDILRDEYVRGPGITGHEAILNMWNDYSKNAYEPELIAGLTRQDVARALLRLTAEIVATDSVDKMRNSLGEWV